MIQLQNLKKQYGSILAVDSISLDIAKGETFGLLGPNGAGKTTTINMIVGIVKPDSGEVRFENKNGDFRFAIGNTPQALAIYEDLTAEENLNFFGKLYNLSGKKLKERVAFALDLVGLESRKKDFAKTFSGGMKRRLNLACAILHDPQILLFDEPTVGVDPQSRNFIFDNIEIMKSEGKTIIYTTHYMEEAERLCDRVAIVDKGNVLALDTVDALISTYGGASVVVAELAHENTETSSLPYEVQGDKIVVETTNPLEVVQKLSACGDTFKSIHINRADLEKVFLNLTGRSLRD
ncbi:MAG: ABC transporter ATP-binding protein [Calditrichaeota bacterium]|nr:MAG: ABC transporter ATP-binding protein [Calditrichota bacterium]